MADATEVAVIDLTNTTDAPLKVTLVIGEVERHIVTLGPGQSSRQVTPSGVSWKFGPALDEEDDVEEDTPPTRDGSKGEGAIH